MLGAAIIAALPQSPTPIFSNTVTGWLTLIGIAAAVISTVIATIVVLAKRGDRDAINRVTDQLNGLGGRVDKLDTRTESGLGKIEGKIDALAATLREDAEETRTLAVTLAGAQTTALGEVKIQVGRLDERSNISKCLDDATGKIIAAIKESRT